MAGNLFFDTFQFKTPKVVKIRSCQLTLLSLVTYAIVLSYVVIYQVFFKSTHLADVTPTGTARIQAQRPVIDHCNVLDPDCRADFKLRKDLPYCSQHDPSDKKLFPCVYQDEHMMNPTKQQGTILMPTRISHQHHHPTGECGIDSDEVCTNIFKFNSRGDSTYIADVERFTLLIDHAFTLPQKASQESLFGTVPQRGATVDFVGYFEQCEDPELRRGCKHIKIPCVPGLTCDGGFSSSERTEDALPGVVGLPVGDVIPLGVLLKLAGIDLDKGTNKEGESWRSTGIAVQVDVDYQNRQPWKLAFWHPGELHYVYRVTKLPVESYKTTIVEGLHNGDRILKDIHGVFIYVSIVGDVAYFSAVQIQLLMATCATLLSIAMLSLSTFAEYFVSFKKEYKNVKYDRSTDFDREHSCCGSAGGAQGTLTREKYKTKDINKQFIEDFVGLDGEALRWAGLVIEKNRQAIEHAHLEELYDQHFPDTHTPKGDPSQGASYIQLEQKSSASRSPT